MFATIVLWFAALIRENTETKLHCPEIPSVQPLWAAVIQQLLVKPQCSHWSIPVPHYKELQGLNILW